MDRVISPTYSELIFQRIITILTLARRYIHFVLLFIVRNSMGFFFVFNNKKNNTIYYERIRSQMTFIR